VWEWGGGRGGPDGAVTMLSLKHTAALATGKVAQIDLGNGKRGRSQPWQRERLPLSAPSQPRPENMALTTCPGQPALDTEQDLGE
jgi:hypothetical protein